MPNFIIDCSENVMRLKSADDIMQEVFDSALSTNLFTASEIKVRINPFSFYNNADLPFVTPETISISQEILAQATSYNVEVVLPRDFVTTKEVKEGSPYAIQRVELITDIPVDIGPETIDLFSKKIGNLQRKYASKSSRTREN